MEKITARLRATNINIKPFTYANLAVGESVEVRASGFWLEGVDQFPVSLHMTVYPGHGIIPALGDVMMLTVEREYLLPKPVDSHEFRPLTYVSKDGSTIADECAFPDCRRSKKDHVYEASTQRNR